MSAAAKKNNSKKNDNKKTQALLPELHDLEIGGTVYHTTIPNFYRNQKKWHPVAPGDIKSMIAGVVKKIFVKKGDLVKQGDCVLLLEAMKMNNEILAPVSGVVKNVFVTENENLSKGTLMIKIKPEKKQVREKNEEENFTEME